MALSISIVTKCEPCMEWHLDQALMVGASDEEVYETIDVAIEMGGGPAGHMHVLSLKHWNTSERKEMENEIVLYGHNTLRTLRVHWILNELSIPYRLLKFYR